MDFGKTIKTILIGRGVLTPKMLIPFFKNEETIDALIFCNISVQWFTLDNILSNLEELDNMHISIVPYVAEHVIQNTNLDQMSLIEICEKLKLLHSEILSMEICTKIGKNLKWEKYSHDEKIQLGDAGSWTDFWEETASHIEWDTLSREEMLFIHNEKSLGKGTICPMVKTGKLSLDDIIEISFSNEFFMREEDFKNLSNSIKWESFTKDDLEKLIKASRFDGIFESPLIHRAIEELGKK